MKTITYRCEVCNNCKDLYQKDIDIGPLRKPKRKKQKMLMSIVDYCEICRMSRTFVKG